MTEFEKLLLNWAISIIAFFLSYAIGKKNGKKEEILTSENLSQVFGGKIELEIQGNDYHAKIIE